MAQYEKYKFKKSLKKASDNYNQGQSDSRKSTENNLFSVSDKIKSEYDMWSWIFQEIANLRLEVSRLATFVRINNKDSPKYLEAYHAHVYSLLIPLSTIIPDKIWKLITDKWVSLKKDIINFNKTRIGSPNRKIPFELIRNLDKLYRIALLAAQKAGLGIRITFDVDLDRAIEDTITGQ